MGKFKSYTIPQLKKFTQTKLNMNSLYKEKPTKEEVKQ